MRKLTLALPLLFLGSAAAFAGLRGDWQSAGGPPMPYFPSYKFLYKCQAELTDHEDRISQGGEIAEGRSYRLYALQKFELSKGKTHASLEGEWQWIAKFFDAPDRESAYQELKKAPAGAFAVAGNYAGLGIARGRSEADDLVTLFTSVKLSMGDYFLTGQDKETVSRVSPTVNARAHASLYREEGVDGKLPPSKLRELYVVCDKAK